MKENGRNEQPDISATSLKLKLALINYLFLGFFLFFSEFINAVFNNNLDEQGAGFSTRVLFTFKPAVMALYVVFSTVLFIIILTYLKPLFSWIKERVYDGDEYRKARTAAIRIPWTIIIFQMAAWSLGTTTYYAMYGFQAESGIPYIFGLLLKLAVGAIAGMYTAILLNLLLIPVKKLLKIQDVRKGENDGFSRIRDSLVVLCSSFYIVITLTYVAYYYARSPIIEIDSWFYIQLFSLSFTSILVSIGLMALSRYEYRVQILSISEVVRALSLESSDPEKRIHILTFNELGEIAGYVNTILNNFKVLIADIRTTSRTIARSTGIVSVSAQQNAAYANEQAAASTEVVSTMEDVDILSKDVGKKINLVAEQSVAVKEHVRDGFSTIQQNMQQMDQVKASYNQTIEGIRNLGEHINSIWEIVKIINGIAGQIKIIAFNAALEASSAGEAGKNFEIVASEIRRLADNTVDSTREIKTRISEIEEASDRLVHLSEQDSGKIRDAWEMSQKIETLFSHILNASDASASSAGEIRESVDKQVNAFEQILITLRQISEAISDFTRTIDENSGTAAALDDTVKTLNTIVEKYDSTNNLKAEYNER